MIRELKVENFRAFRELSLTGLGRVNLLVGANNSGKTSVLEAIAFLASGGDPRALHSSLARRREHTIVEPAARRTQGDAVDVRHLFFGRNIGDEASLKISAVGGDGANLQFRVSTPRVPEDSLSAWREAVAQRAPRPRQRSDQMVLDLDRADRTPRYLRVESSVSAPIDAPLLPNGGLTSENAGLAGGEPERPVAFLATSGIDDDELAGFYEKVVLTPEELSVVAALKEVETDIARLATRQMDSFGGRGFVVGMEGASEPVPLGSLGDGVHRMLAIALSLVTARGGYLLVDEIDLGLHHTVMRKMWTLVFETAKRLDVTVFATAHSYDCVHALAAITRPDVWATGEVSLVRIERGNPQGVHFDEAEISRLAEWQIEAR